MTILAVAGQSCFSPYRYLVSTLNKKKYTTLSTNMCYLERVLVGVAIPAHKSAVGFDNLWVSKVFLVKSFLSDMEIVKQWFAIFPIYLDSVVEFVEAVVFVNACFVGF